jgi:acyl carrier protein
MSTSIEQRVRDLAADLFNVPAQQFTPESSPGSVEGWDSLQQLNLVLAVEQQFEVQLGPEDIEQMGSIGRIVEILEEKLSPGNLAGRA